MKKKVFVLAIVFLIVAAVAVLWYRMPVDIMELDPDAVMEIVVFDGGSGKTLHITDEEQIAHIITNLNEVRMRRDGVSLGRMGYSYKVTIYLDDGEETGDWNNFIINSENTIRKDPFFYRVVDGNLCYEYIRDLY